MCTQSEKGAPFYFDNCCMVGSLPKLQKSGRFAFSIMGLAMVGHVTLRWSVTQGYLYEFDFQCLYILSSEGLYYQL